MAAPYPQRKRTFLWQAVVILLPVVIMAGVALVAVVRDRAAVENEARQRAEEMVQRLQEDFGRRVAMQLSEFDMFSYQWLEENRSRLGGWPGSKNRLAWEADYSNYVARLTTWQANNPGTKPQDVLPNDFSFSEEGHLNNASNVPMPPAPPDWLIALSPEQRTAWDALQMAETADVDSTVTNCVAAFLETSPPADAQANARFILLRHQIRRLDPEQAIQKLRRFPWKDRLVLSECGLPLGALVFAESLGCAKTTGVTEELWRELNDQVYSLSSPLTPLLLDEMESLVATNQVLRDGVAAWRTVWRGNERLRAIADAIRQSGRLRGITTTNLWLDYGGNRWFCMLKPNEMFTHSIGSNGSPVTITYPVTAAKFYPKPVVEQAFGRVLHDATRSAPDYFGYSVVLEGEPLNLPSMTKKRPASPAAVDVLASGNFRMSLPGKMLLEHPQPGEELKLGPPFETFPGHPAFILRVNLADRARLFAANRQRMLLFGGLILVSAVAALVGVFAAHRAFRREQRLSEMKSNFVSSVSHELRAPIASVRLMAESLERGKISEPQRQQEYFKLIGQESRRLSSLIGNVLDFARIEQGRKQYEFEPTDLLALTRETVKLMEPNAAEKGVRLEFNPELGTRNPELDIDARAIQQALINLIDNAIKHSPKGQTVMVRLGCLERRTGVAPVSNSNVSSTDPDKVVTGGKLETAGPAVLLSVTDHGPGIPADEHEHIFERFYRRGSELRRETQGVGIGLSIVKHIVEGHGGRVRIESEVGKGSRFVIELPRMKPQMDAAERR